MPLNIRTFTGEPPSPMQIIAERRIAEWIESGGADHLTNRGKPLDLSENPFVPAEMRLAYKVMRNADVAPDWIEIGKEIETELGRCREAARVFHHSQRGDRIARRTANDAALVAIDRRQAERRERFAGEQRSRLNHVNGLIRRFNVACPLAHLHRSPIDVEHEVGAEVAVPA